MSEGITVVVTEENQGKVRKTSLSKNQPCKLRTLWGRAQDSASSHKDCRDNPKEKLREQTLAEVTR